MLPIIFLLPFVQLLILANAATMDMKEIRMILIDKDRTPLSRELAERFIHSPFFRLVQNGFDLSGAEGKMLKGETDLVVVIPRGFAGDLNKQGNAAVQLQIDAVNGMTAGLIQAYSSQIISGFNVHVASELAGPAGSALPVKQINIENRFWYNTELNFKFYMVPGILVILLTMISMFLASLNLVREKEIGTIEQLNVTPIKKYEFIVGKLVPFWLIALFELAFGLILGKILFDISIEGNLFLLFGFAGLYLIAVLGIGLLVSTISQTQQQVIFVNFFIMITFILMSGIFTPAESMPHWAQQVNIVNPLAYFMRVIRMILLKGSGVGQLSLEFAKMAAFAVIMFTLATWKYSKVN